MKNIRQRNDIDIVVQLKNNEGVALDPTLCSDMTVYLTCGTKKFYVNSFEKFTDGHIKFRFHAEQQTKLGVYNVTISAVTEDGRTFTTDACNAFNLVACSCNAGDDAGEVNVESVEVDATFEITAWGIVCDIVTTEEIADEAVTTQKIANKAITLDKIADGVLSSLGSIIDKGTLTEGNIRSLCESSEVGIFLFIDGERRIRCLMFKPQPPRGNYNYMCITEKEDHELNIEVRGGDGYGHGGWEYFADTTVTQDSSKPISSGAVYNAIYSVLNTEI